MIDKTETVLEIGSNASERTVDERLKERGVEPPAELSAGEQVRFSLAKWILGASAMLMLVAWGIQISVELWGLPDIAAYCGSLGDSGPATVQESDACGIAREIANSRTNAARGIFEFCKDLDPTDSDFGAWLLLRP